MSIKFDEKWDRRFLELATVVSGWSKDPSTGVGAIIVNPLKQVVGVGFNGFAAGVVDAPERYLNKPLKYKMVVHAEQNAIIQAGHRARGSTIYVCPSFWTPNICHDCAKLAIQAGIERVVGYDPDPNNPRIANWKESLELSGEMFREVGIDYYTIPLEVK